MAEENPSPWGGMTRFTRGLLLFLGGMLLFFARKWVSSPAAGTVLVAAGVLLFLAGFIVASWGMAQHWRDMVTPHGEEDDDEKE